MNVNKDVKGWIALGVLIFRTFYAILALSTDHWYEYFQSTLDLNVHEFLGLWKVCMSVKGVTHALKLSKCFYVDDWKGVINYGTKLTSVAKETDFDDNKFQNTYSNTYENDTDNNLGKNTYEKDTDNNLGQNTYANNTDKNLGKIGNIFGEVTRKQKRRSINELLSDSSDLEKFKKMLYPDYLKGIQAIEILALLSGVTAIGLWVVYIVMSTRKRNGVASTVFKIIAIVLIILTAAFHISGVVVWLVKKNKEISNVVDQSHTRNLPDGMDAYFGWSWGMAIAAAVLHLMSIIPIALTKANQPDDMAERVLPHSRV